MTEQALECEDEDEVVTKKLNKEEQENEDKNKQDRTSKMINSLETQIDETNRALDKIKKMLTKNSDIT